MEALEHLADKYSQPTETEQAAPTGQPVPEPTDPDGGGNVAAILVKAMEFGFRRVDDRVNYPEEVYQEAREELGPLCEKYGAAIDTDRIPYREEFRGGLFIGRLWRKSWDSIKAAWAADKAKKKANQESSNGQERKHQPTQPSHPVSGEERPRKEPSPHTSIWHQANG